MYGFLANYRTMLLSPVLETPVETAQDILYRGMIPFVNPRAEVLVSILKESPNPVYQKLAEMCILPKNEEEFMKIFEEDVHGAGTHVFLSNTLYPEWEELGDYHYSKEVLPILPYASWFVNKRWQLIDELAVHILRFQQVCIIMLCG